MRASSFEPAAKLCPAGLASNTPNSPTETRFVLTNRPVPTAPAPRVWPRYVSRAGSKLRLKESPFSLPVPTRLMDKAVSRPATPVTPAILRDRSGQAANAAPPARQDSQTMRVTECLAFILAPVVGKGCVKRKAYCAGVSL